MLSKWYDVKIAYTQAETDIFADIVLEELQAPTTIAKTENERKRMMPEYIERKDAERVLREYRNHCIESSWMRLLGTIEGITFALEDKYAEPIMNNINAIDDILEKDGADNDR